MTIKDRTTKMAFDKAVAKYSPKLISVTFDKSIEPIINLCKKLGIPASDNPWLMTSSVKDTPLLVNSSPLDAR